MSAPAADWIIILDDRSVIVSVAGSYRIMTGDCPEARIWVDAHLRKLKQCPDARRMLRAIGINPGDDGEEELV